VQRSRPPEPPRVDLDRLTNLPRAVFGGKKARHGSTRSSGRNHTAFCVRLCDGRYFPIHGQRGAAPAAQCSNFCPASTTKVFSGSGIDHAVAGDGTRYADLPNAFVYRERTVDGCTCTGRTAGLAYTPVTEDPTLRPGDIVATNSGLAVYEGLTQRQPALTPVASAKISNSLRNQLASVRVTPRPPSADVVPVTTPQAQAVSSWTERRRYSARGP
jgi:hypothetical protein